MFIKLDYLVWTSSEETLQVNRVKTTKNGQLLMINISSLNMRIWDIFILFYPFIVKLDFYYKWQAQNNQYASTWNFLGW